MGIKPGSPGNPWPSHPFNVNNNINGINGDPNGDNSGFEVHTMAIPAITALQDDYIRKVVDTVNDLDNVLYEVGNECEADSVSWEYHVINLIHSYEGGKPKQHPVGLGGNWPGSNNSDLYNSPADYISPSQTDSDDYRNNPPAASGAKVVLMDTDHIFGEGGDANWVWKAFTRGGNVLCMDSLNGTGIPNASAYLPGTGFAYDPNVEASFRRGMGQTRTYAQKMNLAAMTPHGELTNTGYCLAAPGSEYIVFQPGSGGFTVNLSSDTYSVEWMNPADSSTTAGGAVNGGTGTYFTPPFGGTAVLYLLKQNGGAQLTGKVEAESGVLAGGAQVGGDDPTASGNHGVGWLSTPGASVSFSPCAASSSIDVYYQSPNTGKIGLYINSTRYDLNFSAASSWTELTFNQAVPSGATVKIQYDSGDAWLNVDYIVLNATGGDTTAPAAVTNLAVGSPTSSSLTVSWTAPGDDGTSGTATTYDIRYSTSSINESNWASATQVSGEPAPAASGTNQNMTVSGLSSSTTYYFAMKTADEVPNWSSLSNIASGTTSSSGGQLTGKVEAEAGVLGGGAQTYSDAGASGGAAVQYLNLSGSITFNNCAASSSVDVYYCSDLTGKIGVYINSTRYDLYFTSNGGWSAPYVKVTLNQAVPAGATVKIQYDTGDTALNPDYIYLNAGSGGGNLCTGGTPSASGDNAANGEGVAQAFDGNTATKWLTFATTGWIQYEFGGSSSYAVNQYTITSANDMPTRDPNSWTFEGSNDGSNWTTLDTQSGQSFASRFQTNTYNISNSTAYRIYRLNITANHGDSSTQLSEMAMYGSSGGQLTGKVEAEAGVLGGGAEAFSDAGASGGAAVQYLNLSGSITFNNCAASSSVDVYYCSDLTGKIGVYINSTRYDLYFTSNGGWSAPYVKVTLNQAVPAGATVKIQYDTGDTALNPDYIYLNAGSGGGNLCTGGTPSASGDNAANGEGVAQAFDGNTATKWLTFATTGWIQYEFGGSSSYAVNQYTITSANDMPTRDPNSWTFEGSNDGSNWTTLDTQSGQSFASRFQTNTYNISNSTAYRIYRLNITANHGDSSTQLSEMAMYGN